MLSLTLAKKAKLLVRVPAVPGFLGFDIYRHCYAAQNGVGFDMSYWIEWSGKKPVKISPTRAAWYLDMVSKQCRIRRGKQ